MEREAASGKHISNANGMIWKLYVVGLLRGLDKYTVLDLT